MDSNSRFELAVLMVKGCWHLAATWEMLVLFLNARYDDVDECTHSRLPELVVMCAFRLY